jgi:cytochrome P450
MGTGPDTKIAAADHAFDPDVPVFHIDPYDDEFLANPYPHYEAFRDAGPIIWLESYQVFAVARHQEVQAVLTQPAIFCSGAGVGLSNFHKEEVWRTPSIILEADPPEHDRTRKVLTRILSPAALKKLSGIFEQQAEHLIDLMVEMGSCDGVKDLAEAYPLKVFGDAVGIPSEGRENLLPYGDLVFNGFGPMNERFKNRIRESTAVLEWINFACRRENLTADGFGAQLYAIADEGDITHAEAASLVRTMLSAGLDTTVFTLGNVLMTFARHPEQWALLRDDPTKARSALEEVLRYESTFQSFYRTTSKQIEIGGVCLDAGQKILVFIASANRDPRRWPNADRFDINRRASGNMAFGTGIHGCVGQMIARLEGEAVLKALAHRVDSITSTAEPELHLNNTVRGFSQMPLHVTSKQN